MYIVEVDAAQVMDCRRSPPVGYLIRLCVVYNRPIAQSEEKNLLISFHLPVLECHTLSRLVPFVAFPESMGWSCM